MSLNTSGAPSRTWAAAVVTQIGALAVLGIQSGTGEAFQIAAVGVVVSAVVTYLTPEAGGLPVGGVGVGPDPDDAEGVGDFQ